MRKNYSILFTIISIIMLSSTTFAGTWKQENNNWYYINDDGSMPTGWQWIDGNNDGIAECYYFTGDDHHMASDGEWNGYYVNADGAWTDRRTKIPFTKNVTTNNPTQSNASVSTNNAFKATVKDNSNAYRVWQDTAKFTSDSNGTYSMSVEAYRLRKRDLGIRNVKIIGYDANGSQTFTTVEEETLTHLDNVSTDVVFKCNGIPSNTSIISIQDFT